MSILDRALHIPVETGFLSAPRRSLERVLLPLEARPGWRLAVVAAFACLIFGACLFLGLAFVLSPAATPGQYAFKFSAAALFAVLAGIPAGVVVTAIRDLSQRRRIIVDGEGVRDTRLAGETIGWLSVARAELVTSGPGPCAVRLVLKTEGAGIYNPFRAGGWCARWTGRHRERVVALLLLDKRPHLLAQTILTLAARNGVEIDRPRRWEHAAGDARSPWQ